MTAPGNISSIPQLIANIKAEIEGFSAFCDILQTEQEALVSSEIDQLPSIAKLKSEKVVLLAQLAEERNRFLAEQSLLPDQNGMEILIKMGQFPDPNGDIPKSWGKLIDLAKKAQHLNAINGIMIETKLGNNQQALAVLQSAANQATLYGPDGKTHTAGTGRPLGKG